MTVNVAKMRDTKRREKEEEKEDAGRDRGMEGQTEEKHRSPAHRRREWERLAD